MLRRVLLSYMPSQLGWKGGLVIVLSCAEKETMNINRSHEIVSFSHAIHCIIHAFVCVMTLKRARLCLDLIGLEWISFH